MLSQDSVITLFKSVFSDIETKDLKKRPKEMERLLKIFINTCAIASNSQKNLVPTWGPSKAEDPSPTHMRFYGVPIGSPKLKGEIPGQRWGCKCIIIYVKKR